MHSQSFRREGAVSLRREPELTAQPARKCLALQDVPPRDGAFGSDSESRALALRAEAMVWREGARLRRVRPSLCP